MPTRAELAAEAAAERAEDLDTELESIKTVCSTLDELDHDQKQRIMAYLNSRYAPTFGMTAPPLPQTDPPPDPPE